MKIALQGVVDSVTPGGVDYSLYLDVIIAYLGRKNSRGCKKNLKKFVFCVHSTPKYAIIWVQLCFFSKYKTAGM